MGRNQGSNAQENPEESKAMLDDESQEIEFSKEDMEEFKEFVGICLVTGELPENYQKTFTEIDKEKFQEKFRSWQKEGKPRPTLPESAKKHVEIILKLYRARDRGVEYMYRVVQGQSTPVGIKKTPIYANDGDGNPDHSNQIGNEESYSIKYNEKEFKKLIDKAKRDSSRPRFYLVEGIGATKIKLAIRNPENLLKNFDELLQMQSSGKAL